MIAGATRPEQVHANAAAGAWVPSDAELAELHRSLTDAQSIFIATCLICVYSSIE